MEEKRRPEQGDETGLKQGMILEPNILSRGVGCLEIPKDTVVKIIKINNGIARCKIRGTPFVLLVKTRFLKDIEVKNGNTKETEE